MIKNNKLVFLALIYLPNALFTQQTSYDNCVDKDKHIFTLKNEWYSQLRFDRHFSQDSIDIVVDGYPIGKYEISTSPIYNYTFFGVYIFKLEDSMLCIHILPLKKVYYIENISGDGYLSLSLRLNNRPSYYRFDLSKGRHIYIHKNRKRRNRFVIKQQTNYQQYDE